MRKPSDSFRIDETNDLLGQVAGGFKLPGQRMTGGEGGKLDTRMQVEETNDAVEAIVGGGLSMLNESGPKSSSHVAIHESWDDDSWGVSKGIKDLANNLDELQNDLSAEADNAMDTAQKSIAADMKHDQVVVKDMLKLVAELQKKFTMLKSI